MSYNDILDYMEREYNDEVRHTWKFRKILSHSLISGKKGVENKIKVQMLWETGATSVEYFETLCRCIPVGYTIYTKDNNLLEEEGWKKLKHLQID